AALERLPWRDSSISASSRARDSPRWAAIAFKSSQNACSSDRLVRWPAITTERFRKREASSSTLLARVYHCLRPHQPVVLFGVQYSKCRCGFTQSDFLGMRLACHFRGGVVADARRQCSDQHQ